MKDTVKSIMTITCCLVGASYLTGEELVGNLGCENTLLLTAISCILYSFAVWLVISFSKSFNIHSINQAVKLLPPTAQKSVKTSLYLATFALMCNMSMVANTVLASTIDLQSSAPIGAIMALLLGCFLVTQTKLIALKRINLVLLILAIILLASDSHWHKLPINSNIDYIATAHYTLVNVTVTLPLLLSKQHEKSHPLLTAVGVAIMLLFISFLVLATGNLQSNQPVLNTIGNHTVLTLILLVSATCTIVCCLNTLFENSLFLSKNKMLICLASCLVAMLTQLAPLMQFITNTALFLGYLSLAIMLINAIRRCQLY